MRPLQFQGLNFNARGSRSGQEQLFYKFFIDVTEWQGLKVEYAQNSTVVSAS
jgi:hypothetical protein